MMRSQSLEHSLHILVAKSQRSKSLAPSYEKFNIDKMPCKVPPPWPPQNLRVGTYYPLVLNVVYACSGEPVKTITGYNLRLNVDFTHSVANVESSINVLAKKSLHNNVHIVDPVSNSPSDLLLTLCAKRKTSKVQIVIINNQKQCIFHI